MRASPASPSLDSPSALASRLGADLAWQVLLSDSGTDISLIDSDGRIRFITRPIRWWAITADPSEVPGRTLTDLLGSEMAAERLTFIRRALAENLPVTVYSLVRGMRIRTIYRPVTTITGESERLVLVVGRPADDVFTDIDNSGSESGPVVNAKIVDLGPLASLTPREMEVLRLIGQGLSTAQIAKSLNRSVKTVEAHRLSLGLKLKARNRVDLARLALRAGLTLGEPVRPD